MGDPNETPMNVELTNGHSLTTETCSTVANQKSEMLIEMLIEMLRLARTSLKWPRMATIHPNGHLPVIWRIWSDPVPKLGCFYAKVEEQLTTKTDTSLFGLGSISQFSDHCRSNQDLR